MGFRSGGAVDDCGFIVPLLKSGFRNRTIPDVLRLATLLMRLPTQEVSHSFLLLLANLIVLLPTHLEIKKYPRTISQLVLSHRVFQVRLLHQGE
jgi:hypothetical protein